jgi:hypothetical protein
MRNSILAVLLFVLLGSCNVDGYKFPQADIEVPAYNLEIHRYGKALFELDTSDFQNGLKAIQNEFSLFLGADLNDSMNVVQLYNYATDTQLISIYNKTVEVYPNLNEVQNSLSEAFGRFHYYFPEIKLPEVYTYLSDLYYEMPVFKSDTSMIIALDVYLGKDFYLYKKLGLPFYKVRCMSPENLPVDVMKTLYLSDVSRNIKKKTLLDHMIEGGKMLAYLDAVLPYTPDSVKICYSTDKLKWVNENEKMIWAFLIENDLLYSTDYQTQTKLIQDGPFTTGFSNESPSRIGIYIGWLVINKFLNNNPEISLHEMLRMTDSQMILQQSGYKP